MDELKHEGFLPKFSLRWMAFWFTISIFFAWVIRQAVLGSQWASAAVFTFGVIAVLFAMYAAIFLAVWLPSYLAGMERAKFTRTQSFDNDEASPQQALASEQEQSK